MSRWRSGRASATGWSAILKPAIDGIAPWFSAAWDLVVAGVKVAGNAIINTHRAAFETVRAIWNVLPRRWARRCSVRRTSRSRAWRSW